MWLVRSTSLFLFWLPCTSFLFFFFAFFAGVFLYYNYDSSSENLLLSMWVCVVGGFFSLIFVLVCSPIFYYPVHFCTILAMKMPWNGLLPAMNYDFFHLFARNHTHTKWRKEKHFCFTLLSAYNQSCSRAQFLLMFFFSFIFFSAFFHVNIFIITFHCCSSRLISFGSFFSLYFRWSSPSPLLSLSVLSHLCVCARSAHSLRIKLKCQKWEKVVQFFRRKLIQFRRP